MGSPSASAARGWRAGDRGCTSRPRGARGGRARGRRRSVHALDEVEGGLEFAPAGRLVDDAREPAPLVAHPAAGVVARAEVGAHAQALDLGQQRLLHAALAAEFHERGDAVAQELGHRERGEKTRCRVSAPCASGRSVPRIAADSRAFARHADVEEGLAEVVRAAGVRDQPVGRAVAGVHVRVDEAGSDELARRVDHQVGGAVEARAHMDDAPVFPHHDAVADQRVRAAAEPDDPAAPGSIRARDLAGRVGERG